MNLSRFTLVSGSILFTALIFPAQAETYRGGALGYNGTIEVEVEWTDDQIADIRVISHSDTPGLAEPAFDALSARVIDQQNTDIDAVSGATYSSRGFLQAAENAIDAASGDGPVSDATEPLTGMATLPLVDGRYRGAFGDSGEQQVVVQFDLRGGVLSNLSYRQLYYSGEDYREINDQHPSHAVKQQHEQVLERLDGMPLSAIEELRNTSELADDIDGFSGATLRGSKIYSAFRDALNRGVYTPTEKVQFDFRRYADGRYRGTFGDSGEQQVNIQFDLVDNRFQNLSFRHLVYNGIDYRSLDRHDALYPVNVQHQKILDYLDGKSLDTVVDLYQPSDFIEDVDGFSGATVRSNKVLSAIMNALSRQPYTPADASILDLGEPVDGRYRGIFEDGGVQQIAIQFFVANGRIADPSFRHLYYSDTDYRALQPGDELYPVRQQHREILNYIDGKPVQSLVDLHNTEDILPDIDGFSGATIRGNKVYSAIVDALNRGIY